MVRPYLFGDESANAEPQPSTGVIYYLILFGEPCAVNE